MTAKLMSEANKDESGELIVESGEPSPDPSQGRGLRGESSDGNRNWEAMVTKSPR